MASNRSEVLTQWLTSRVIGPLAVALAVMVLVVSEAGFSQLNGLSQAREASVETQLAAGRLRRALLFMESSKRGYMLTGRQDYLGPFVEQEKVFQETLDQVRKVAGTDTDQRVSLNLLVELAQRKHSEMTEVLRLWNAGERDAAIELTLTDLGREMMAQISAVTDTVIREESVFYDQTSRDRSRVFLWSRVGIWVLVALCISGALALMRLGRDQERERRVHLLQLHAERDRLDEEVTRRTAETVELARHMERVREDERARLARELHDELGGLLTAAKLDVARIRKRIQDDTGTKQQLLEHLGQSLDAGIALKRRIIEDLRPSSLSNLGLKRTLEIQCAEFGQRAELPVHLQVDEVALTSERSLAVYRFVQEALTNIAKYAQARSVRVVMQRVSEGVELRVEDDGVGFDVARVTGAGGHGLQGMRFRIRSCGGDVQIRSAPGQGTSVQALLPL
ncbi:MAG: CHASE3 domain-containing protein [Burkholderiaceae bacterium]|nr:CHASE3 domain-containing protein [Rhodoferax sp.]MCP5283594.1 CHASE3 domain-containing protein [Burkholderiaceae bacterium]